MNITTPEELLEFIDKQIDCFEQVPVYSVNEYNKTYLTREGIRKQLEVIGEHNKALKKVFYMDVNVDGKSIMEYPEEKLFEVTTRPQINIDLKSVEFNPDEIKQLKELVNK